MGFLRSQAGSSGTFNPNPISTGFGHMIGADPSRVSMIANRIGTGMNSIAAAGGATPSYDGSAAPINNHLQMLDPDTLRKILAQFRPTSAMGAY